MRRTRHHCSCFFSFGLCIGHAARDRAASVFDADPASLSALLAGLVEAAERSIDALARTRIALSVGGERGQ